MIEGYNAFIRKAFLDPIRSALIIDDDYPTYDDILAISLTEEASKKEWREAPQRARNLIHQFRNRETPLLVDIHDGRNVSVDGIEQVAKHLHQSDLLVLDYELDRSREEDGGRAISILRQLAANSHFNMVVIYTSMSPEQVFQEVRLGLLSRSEDLAAYVSDTNVDVVERMEAAENIWEGAENDFLNSIGNEAYLAYRLEPRKDWTAPGKLEQPMTEFGELCERAGFSYDDRQAVLMHALEQREQELQNELNATGLGLLSWSNGGLPWVQGDSLFVAFAQKGQHDHIMERLGETLSAWSPPPSRLFLSRLRAEIDEQGFAAQSGVLGRRRALAFWYNRLLKADGELRLQYVAESMRGHADLLLEEVLPKVSGFANDMVEFDNSSTLDGNVICSRRFKVDLSDPVERHNALIEHNVLVSSRPVGGRHLTTGHVFRKEEEYWICLSPACDMVPGQGSAHRREWFGDWMPFVAVLLHPGDDAQSTKGRARLQAAVNDGRYIFLNLDNNEDRKFLFTKESNSQPVWTIAYAKSGGVFHSKGQRDRVVSILWTEKCGQKLSSIEVDAEVVGQMRYEYALNLLTKVGGSFSRIGLDFVGSIT